MSRQRLDYIDTLKGFAIIFVVLLHCFVFVPIYTPSIAAIPLFFVLSGLFHNDNQRWYRFVGKLAFTLLIPYIAYNIIPAIATYLLNCIRPILPNHHDLWAIFYTDNIDDLINYPLWFLPALFVTQVIFMIISTLCRQAGRWGRILLGILAITIGYVGYRLPALPLFVDKGITGVMFYAIGYLAAHTPLLKNNGRYDTIGYLLIVPMAALYLLTRNRIDMAFNAYGMPYGVLIIHIFSLFVASLYLCKLIQRLPLVTYMGRNSLIVLCTHAIIITPLYLLLRRYSHTTYDPFILAVAVIALLYYVAIPFCRKFLPLISGIKPQQRK